MNFQTTATAKNILALLLIAFSFASCTDDSALAVSQDVLERTDIVVAGDMQLNEFNANPQTDASVDLVSFDFFGHQSNDINFNIQLTSGYTLVIKVHDNENGRPWEQVGQPYNIYPGQMLEDKLMYVSAEIRVGDDSPAYATNLATGIPAGIVLDVFKITKNDGAQLQARIRDLKLYKNTDPTKTIIINGTFVGALDF